MRWLSLLLVAAILAGCNAPDDAGARPTPRVVSRPTLETPGAKLPAALHLMSVAVVPNETELGVAVEAAARIVNVGEGRGEAEVLFEIVGGPSAHVVVSVDGHGSADARANLTPTSGGNLAVRARLGGEEDATALLVRAPRIANLTVEARAVEPCGAVRVTTGIQNVGDAPARGARADLEVLDQTGARLVAFTTRLGDIAPGQRAESTADVSEVRAACVGEDPPPTYGVRFVVHVAGLPDSVLTGVIAP